MDFWGWLKSGSGIYAFLTGEKNYSSDQAVQTIEDAKIPWYQKLNINRVLIVTIIAIFGIIYLFKPLRLLIKKKL